MALLPLIIIILLKTISQLLYVILEIIISRRKFTEYSNNYSRDTWNTLYSLNLCKNTSNDVILNHNGSRVSDTSAIAEVFNNYF